MEYEVGTVLEGKVTSITKFGAFVALEGGKSGLVHISEIANSYVNDVHDFLQEGQDVKVKLLAIKDGKLDLSIKKALPAPERPAQRSFQPVRQQPPVPRRLPGGPPFRQRTPPFRRSGLRGQAQAVSLLLGAGKSRNCLDPEHLRQAGSRRRR